MRRVTAILIVKHNQEILIEQEIENGRNDSEWFYEYFKKIEYANGKVIVKGHRDADWLPSKVDISAKIDAI